MTALDRVHSALHVLQEREESLRSGIEAERSRCAALEAAARAAFDEARCASVREAMGADRVYSESPRRSSIPVLVVDDEFVVFEQERPEHSSKGPFRPYSPGARWLVALGVDSMRRRSVVFHRVHDAEDVARVLFNERGNSTFVYDAAGVLAHLADSYFDFPRYPQDPLSGLV